jgi:CheY-like chemotaxis protein
MLESSGFVVEEAATGSDAIAMTSATQPDIVLLDIQLPDIDGLEVARRLHADPSPPVVVLTSGRDLAEYGPRGREAPSAGFVPKHRVSGGALRELLAKAS